MAPLLHRAAIKTYTQVLVMRRYAYSCIFAPRASITGGGLTGGRIPRIWSGRTLVQIVSLDFVIIPFRDNQNTPFQVKKIIFFWGGPDSDSSIGIAKYTLLAVLNLCRKG